MRTSCPAAPASPSSRPPRSAPPGPRGCSASPVAPMAPRTLTTPARLCQWAGKWLRDVIGTRRRLPESATRRTAAFPWEPTAASGPREPWRPGLGGRARPPPAGVDWRVQSGTVLRLSAGRRKGSRFPGVEAGQRGGAFRTAVPAVQSLKTVDFNMPGTQPPEMEGPNTRTPKPNNGSPCHP